MIKLFYARYEQSSHGNFGDELSPLIVKMLRDEKAECTRPGKCELVAIGSVLDIFGVRTLKKIPRLFRRISSVHIWGSGLMFDEKITFPHYVKFHAVRGNLTKNYIKNNAHIVVGDPGLLADQLIRKSTVRNKTIGIIPHYVDQDSPYLKQLLKTLPDSQFIDVLAPVEEVLQQISRCDVVLSSSLHGLIVADSFGVPNQWVEFSDAILGDRFKFHDYYSCFDLKEPINCWELKKKIPTMEDISSVKSTYDRSGIDAIKVKLSDSLKAIEF